MRSASVKIGCPRSRITPVTWSHILSPVLAGKHFLFQVIVYLQYEVSGIT